MKKPDWSVDEFVRRDVFYCVSELVDAMIKCEIDGYEDLFAVNYDYDESIEWVIDSGELEQYQLVNYCNRFLDVDLHANLKIANVKRIILEQVGLEHFCEHFEIAINDDDNSDEVATRAIDSIADDLLIEYANSELDLDDAIDVEDLKKLILKNADFQNFCDHFSIEANEIEVYEYWLISENLALHLELENEIVIRDFLGLTIWGRTTTGQAIACDSVIERIFNKIWGSDHV